jgi:hypothetical protein
MERTPVVIITHGSWHRIGPRQGPNNTRRCSIGNGNVKRSTSVIITAASDASPVAQGRQEQLDDIKRGVVTTNVM